MATYVKLVGLVVDQQVSGQVYQSPSLYVEGNARLHTENVIIICCKEIVDPTYF